MPPDASPSDATARLQARFTGILDAALDCIITIDRQGCITDFNAAAERTFGFERDKVLGREMAELIIPPAMRERHRMGLSRLVETGESKGLLGRRVEVSALRADGTEFPVELTITRVGEGDDLFFTAYFREDAAARLQTRFTAILDAALDCIVTIDHNGRVVDFNAAASRTFGYPREQAVGREMAELIVPVRMREGHRQGLARLVASGQSSGVVGRRIEMPALHADGHEFPVELAITRVESGGAQPFFTAYLRDISDRHRADAARRESRTYFEKSFHSSPALMSIASAVDGKLIEVNPAFLAGAGYSREEALGHSTLELGLWLSIEQRNEFLRRIRTDRIVRDMEADFRSKTGLVRTLILNADLIELNGQPCMLTVGIEVTERRRQERLQTATYQISRAVLLGGDLKTLFGEVHQIVRGLMSAKNFYIALLSPDGETLSFPYFVDEYVTPPPARRRDKGFTEYILETGQPQRVTASELTVILRARGVTQPALEHPAAQRIGAPMIAGGHTLGAIALQDYERADAYAEEDLRLLNFVAEQTALAVQRRQVEDALRVAKEAADAASRAKSYFLASVSHELRTPLNGILGYTQILRRDAALTEKQREGVRVIHESADHLLALINDVLDLSKIEAGRIELHPADFDLPEFATGVERVFMPRAREKSILFESAVATDLPRWVRGDEQRLRQVVFNLVSNAVKFTKTGGVVFSVQRVTAAGHENVPATEAGETIRFSVSDTGLGISEEDVKKLFEPFTQVGNKASAAATGTGLGLAISRSLVERMGGRMHVESKPGWGSRFWFDVTLPIATGAPAPAVTTRRVVGYDGPRRRVLIVDDNAANRAVMVDMLAPLGFELAEAGDGLAALTEAERFLPDLVLMDLRLPGIDGLEATRRLRQTARGPALRIVAVSASAYDLDRSECLVAGCDDFLAKPFREEQLWTMIERTLGLAWHQAESEETRSPFPVALQAPPPAEASAIYDLAAKGDVVGIRARAQALIAQNPKYAPFAQNVLDLASRFKMKAIRQFVARYIAS